ncbi:MAG: beta-ketoacyl synthase N-terminal-like domain-containing protein [Cyanobacteria bacterium J06639_1]
MTTAATQLSPNAIAIIGMANRFPGADTPAQYWQNLSQGVESVSFFSDEELQANGVSQQMRDRPNFVNAGVVLEDVDLFDADFFGYPPRQAQIMDPQQRLFLELAWEALETAGYNPNLCSYPISLFGGVGVGSYFLYNLFSNPELIATVGVGQIRHSNRPDNLATRVAYKLNLKGSALTVQTGCSSSLVSVHLPCQSLLDRESDLALAGGSCIQLPQAIGYLHQEGGINSPDGHCRAFDARAAGTIFGSGAGIVVLKRLEEAIEDGDTIYATIRSSAINNDGSAKMGYTAPSIEGQAAVIAEAMAMAEVNPSDISYVEAHGTGTALGDPIEVAALTQAFHTETSGTLAPAATGYCALGSVKTNLGHLDVAAGIAGLIKTVLALHHRQLPPSLHYQSPNPAIDFARSPFYVNTALKDWDCGDRPRLAGVSSFGIGGTNAHVILEEAPVPTSSGASRAWQLLPLSAKTPAALDAATTQLVEYLQQHPDRSLADAAYTLQLGRVPFTHRRFALCQSTSEAIAALQQPNRSSTSRREASDKTVAFLFPGQGSQHVEMGRDLYDSEPVFRQKIDRCCQILESLLDLDLRSLLYPEPEARSRSERRLKQTDIAQPALFVVSYAWAQWWASWSIHPQMAIGHSIGEYVVACLAGVFSLEDALHLVAVRGRLMAQMPPGAMVAVPLAASDIEPLLVAGTAIAAYNAPELCAVSGTPEAIATFQTQLEQQGINYRPLHTSHAFHTSAVESVAPAFAAELATISLNAPQFPFISNLTGTWIDPDMASDPDYWVRHMRQPVRFADGVQCLLKSPDVVLLEVGPGQALTTLARKQATSESALFASARHPKQERSDIATALEALGHMWQCGVEVDWKGGYGDEQRHRIPLPTYPFQRQRHWVDMSPQFLRALAGSVVPTETIAETPSDNNTASAAIAPPPTDSQPVTQETSQLAPLSSEDAPTSEAEIAIARAWEKVLGIAPIGIHANFFELGGDSVQGIQILSLVRQAGWQVDPAQLFQHQTVASLAAIATPTQPNEAEQGIVAGAVPLVPKHQRFLSQQLLHPESWVRSLVLDCDVALDPELLKEATRLCLLRHDALRLSFAQTENGWSATQSDEVVTVPFSVRSVAAPKRKEEEVTIRAAVTEIQAGFDLDTGPLLHVAWFERGGDRPGRLWISAHEFAIDRTSLLVLLEDLLLAYQVLQRGMTVEFRPKTCSFKQWAEQLPEVAECPPVKAERPYWQNQLQTSIAPLPLDRPRGENLAKSTDTVKIAISKRYTQQLQEKVSATGIDIEAFFLTALLVALGDWTGARSLAVDLEASGRELLERSDFSETVGAFSSTFPVRLAADFNDAPPAIAQKVAETLQAVPHGGVHFGLLDRLAATSADGISTDSRSRSPIRFEHLGTLVGTESASENSTNESPTSSGLPLTLVPELCQSSRDPSDRRPYVLDLQSYIAQDCLNLHWQYSSALHDRKTIVKLAETTAKTLQTLAAADSQSEPTAPPSFAAAQIDPKDRDRLLDALRSSR